MTINDSCYLESRFKADTRECFYRGWIKLEDKTEESVPRTSPRYNVIKRRFTFTGNFEPRWSNFVNQRKAEGTRG